MDVWLTIMVSANGLLLVVCGFLIVKFWDRGEKDKEEIREEFQDENVKVRADQKDDRGRIDKNTEHIAAFRADIGVISNDVVNKVDFLTKNQTAIQADIREIRQKIDELNLFIRGHLDKISVRTK